MLIAAFQIVVDISIHAPARGATHHSFRRRAVQIISIHAPARGATHTSSLALLLPPDFNPRPREGGDSKDAQFHLRIFDK